MKKTTAIYLLSTITTFILYGNLHAQRLTVGATSDIVTVNSSSASVNNLLVIDSLGQSEVGQVRDYEPPIVHLACFEIVLGSPEAKNILTALYSGIQGQQIPALTLQKLNAQRQVMEERNFSMVTVKEILFPELNAELREPSKAKVIIQAHDVSYHDNPGGRMATYPDKGSRMAISSRFRLVVDNLPAQRVLRISNLRIIPSSKPEYLYFSVDLPSEDARQWNDWFKTTVANPSNKEASIILMDEATSQNVFSIQLSEVEIVSVSVSSIPGSVAKTRIGLRTKNLPVIQ